MRSIPLLTNAASSEGFTNARHDSDGALRRVPLLLFKEGRSYPSLALASLLLASDHRTLRLTQAANETTLIWGERRIPLDSQGNMLVDFRTQEQPFPYISASTILDNLERSVSLKGKIVLVGAWARGLGDSHIVPSGQSLNGLAIHATVIDNILSGTFINRPSWGSGAELSAILFLGLAGTWLFCQPGFTVSLATVAVGVAGSFGGCAWLLASKGLYLSPLLPMLTPIVLALFLGLLKYGIESRKVQQRTLNLIEAQDAVILGMSALTAARDKETGGHILRTQRYVETLARHLASTPRYHSLDETNIELLVKSAPLHDIGKVGIPDSILQKAGSLTEQEYAIMKTHTLIGSQALLTAISSAVRPEHLDFLNYARQMTESHHESWDGNGYPHGLRGDAIPLAGRLMSLADVYDAMTIRRRYQESIPHETTRDYIVKNSGIRFDPDVVAAFVATCETFQHIAHEYADESAAAEASADLSGTP
jgi:adenylate cyclase